MPGETKKLDPDHIFPINGSDFFCKFILRGSESFISERDDGGNIGALDFSKSAIVSMDIQDNFFEPFTSGSFTVNNPFDFIEDNVKLTGDGNDLLEVTLEDTSKRTTDELEPLFLEQEFRKKTRALKYKFVVLDENNNTSKTDRSNNFKTYTLLDESYYKLHQAIPYGKRYNGLVGDIIQEVLEEFGFEIDTDRWEPGNHRIDVFPEYIIPPSSFRYSDLLKYLLKIYYYKDGTAGLPVQGILKQERTEDIETVGKFTLQPLTKIFENNKKLVIEAFGIQDLIDTDIAEPSNPNNPTGGDFVPVNKFTGQLKNTNLTSPLTKFVDNFFINYTAESVNQFTGAHVKDIIRFNDDTNEDRIREKWIKTFVECFECVGGTPKPNFDFDKRTIKKFKSYRMPFEPKKVKDLAIAQLVSNLIFFNLNLNFDCIGDTNRRAGTFIDVFRKGTSKKVKNPDLPAGLTDPKLLGRWLLCKVRHRFIKDKYQTVLQCVKSCIGPDDFMEKTIKQIKKQRSNNPLFNINDIYA